MSYIKNFINFPVLFLSKSITYYDYILYPPKYVPNYNWLFPKVKRIFKGEDFPLLGIAEIIGHKLWRQFQNRKSQCFWTMQCSNAMQWCIDARILASNVTTFFIWKKINSINLQYKFNFTWQKYIYLMVTLHVTHTGVVKSRITVVIQLHNVIINNNTRINYISCTHNCNLLLPTSSILNYMREERKWENP